MGERFGSAGIFSTDNPESDHRQIEAEGDDTCPECGRQGRECSCEEDDYNDHDHDGNDNEMETE